MLHRRVVVTGLGLVSPLGADVSTAWSRLLSGQIGVRKLPQAEAWSKEHGLKVSVGAPVLSRDEDPEHGFDESNNGVWMNKSLSRTASPFIRYALGASHAALADASLPTKDLSPDQLTRIGVSIGSGMGSPDDLYEAGSRLLSAADGSGGNQRRQRPSPFALPRALVNLAAGQVSIQHGLRGPNLAPSTACTAGAHAIGDACRAIQFGDADVMLAGGAEASVSPLGLGLFAGMRALSFQSDPTLASRPFDTERDGFVMGAGAAVLVLEELTHALHRGAPIYAEVCGYGLSADAHHVTAPDGGGARLCMKAALRSAGISPHQVGYVNAHATSTPLGDDVECSAIEDILGTGAGATADSLPMTNSNVGFGGLFSNTHGQSSISTHSSPPPDHEVMVSSTKASTGHMLGAAGAIEAMFTVLSVHHGWVPPTATLDTLKYTALGESDSDPSSADVPTGNILRPQGHSCLAFPRGQGIQLPDLRYAMSNSFGFGGTNASLLLGKYDPDSL